MKAYAAGARRCEIVLGRDLGRDGASRVSPFRFVGRGARPRRPCRGRRTASCGRSSVPSRSTAGRSSSTSVRCGSEAPAGDQPGDLPGAGGPRPAGSRPGMSVAGMAIASWPTLGGSSSYRTAPWNGLRTSRCAADVGCARSTSQSCRCPAGRRSSLAAGSPFGPRCSCSTADPWDRRRGEAEICQLIRDLARTGGDPPVDVRAAGLLALAGRWCHSRRRRGGELPAGVSRNR
jgi:hypothetical protein